MTKLARAIIVVCACALIGACGIKGPLYLPNAPKDTTWPVKPGRSAPPAPAPAASSPAPPPAPGPDLKP